MMYSVYFSINTFSIYADWEDHNPYCRSLKVETQPMLSIVGTTISMVKMPTPFKKVSLFREKIAFHIDRSNLQIFLAPHQLASTMKGGVGGF